MEQTKYDVFISYSRKDSIVANKITKAFEEAGITFFIDRQGIGGGMEFPAVLAKAIRDSKVFLFLASKNSYESKFTQSEIVYAFNKKQKQDIIPYIIDGSSLPEELEFTFSAINWRNLKQHPIETTLIDDVLMKVGKQRVVHGDGENNVEEPRSVFSKNRWMKYAKNPITGKGLAISIFVIAIVLLLFVIIISKAFLRSHSIFFELTVVLSMFISFSLFFIGLVRPASVCLNNRKEVAKYYLSSLFITFFAFCILVNKEPKTKDVSTEAVDSIIDDSTCIANNFGLPNGTLWGNRNVGAKSPTDYGYLYVRGEVETKEDLQTSTQTKGFTSVLSQALYKGMIPLV